jgi:predicted XRE-type DNA-binding protein
MVNVVRSTGNVFADLGFGPEESAHLKVRSDLMLDLRQFIENSEISQTRAAQMFGVSQPRVSDLVRGRIDLFSTDSLIEMAVRAGLTVRVYVGS